MSKDKVEIRRCSRTLLPSLKLTYPLKMDGWNIGFLWECLFSGAMLVLGSVRPSFFHAFFEIN